jgi:hypothetical protein
MPDQQVDVVARDDKVGLGDLHGDGFDFSLGDVHEAAPLARGSVSFCGVHARDRAHAEAC